MKTKQKTKLDVLDSIILSIVEAMEMTFDNGECISCKEMALACLEAINNQYCPKVFQDAIQTIRSI